MLGVSGCQWPDIGRSANHPVSFLARGGVKFSFSPPSSRRGGAKRRGGSSWFLAPVCYRRHQSNVMSFPVQFELRCVRKVHESFCRLVNRAPPFGDQPSTGRRKMRVRNVGRFLVFVSAVSVGAMPTLMASCGSKNGGMGHYMAASDASAVTTDCSREATKPESDAAARRRHGLRGVENVRDEIVRLRGDFPRAGLARYA